MNPDTDMNLFGWLFVRVVSFELALNLLGALHGMNDGRKIDQEGIPDGFDDCAMTIGDCPLDNLIMNIQQPQHPPFVRAHLATKAHDVGEHDRGQTAGLGLHDKRYFPPPMRDYQGGPMMLSINTGLKPNAQLRGLFGIGLNGSQMWNSSIVLIIESAERYLQRNCSLSDQRI